jgi:hypothetical protein
LGLFCLSVLLLRMTTETIAPAQVRFPMPLYHIGRLIFGFGGAVVTMSIIILAFHTAPVYKQIFGVVDYKAKPPFHLGLDHQFLGFFQYSTGAVFARYGLGQRDPFREYGTHGGVRYAVQFFDPHAEWLIRHEEARPYGEGSIVGSEEAGGAAAEAGAEAGQAAPGGAQPGGPPGKQGRGGPGGGGRPPN